jgi:hypothetical protein
MMHVYSIYAFCLRDSTDQTSQANLRKLNFTNTLYQLAYYQVSVITAPEQILLYIIIIELNA